MIRIKYFLLLCLSILSLIGLTQNANLAWAKSIGGINGDHAYSCALDQDGNLLITGSFSGFADFDPGIADFYLSAAGASDIFVQKLDASGNFLWAFAIGGIAADQGKVIATDELGNVYLSGYFTYTVDFDPGPGVFQLISNGTRDMFVLKLDPDGNFVWAKSVGGTAIERGYGLVVGDSEEVYVAGTFNDKVDFDPGPATVSVMSNGGLDVFVQKMDSAGNFLWVRSIGGSSNDYAYDLSLGIDGEIYVIGSFRDTVDFNPGAGTFEVIAIGESDVFIQCLQANGDLDWVRTFGSTYLDFGYSVLTDQLGNVIISGTFEDIADFDPGPNDYYLSSNGNKDIFLVKLDGSGNFIWARSLGGSSFDYGNALAKDGAGNIYLTGSFTEVMDFNPGSGTFISTSGGNRDIYVLKLADDGGFYWAKTLGGIQGDIGYSIDLDKKGNVYVVGSFMDIVDFDPGSGVYELGSIGDADVFIQKYVQCAADTTIDVAGSCFSYTWMDGITYTASNDSATFSIITEIGCDSVIVLELTIDTVNTNVKMFASTLMAEAAGASYQWLDCDNSFAIVAGETGQNFTPMQHGNYAVEITRNACVDTSECIDTSIGIESIPEKGQISIYPNPVSNTLSIQLGELQQVSVYLYDIDGHLIYSSTGIYAIEYQIQFTQAPGIYMIQVITESGSYFRRLIKQ